MSTMIESNPTDQSVTGSHRVEDRSPVECELEIVVPGQAGGTSRRTDQKTIPGWSVNVSASGLYFRCGLELSDEKPLIRFFKGDTNHFAEYELRHARLVSEGIWEYGATLRRNGLLNQPQSEPGLTYRLSDEEFGSLIELATSGEANALQRPLDTVRSACPLPTFTEPKQVAIAVSTEVKQSAIPHTASEPISKPSQSSCLWALVSMSIAVILSTGHIWGATSVTRYSSFALAVGSIATIEWMRSKLREHRHREAATLAAVKAHAATKTAR